MRSPSNKQSSDRHHAPAERRKAERRAPSDRRAEAARQLTGDRRVVDNRGIADSMVDALEDILKWERASERSLKAADPAN